MAEEAGTWMKEGEDERGEYHVRRLTIGGREVLLRALLPWGIKDSSYLQYLSISPSLPFEAEMVSEMFPEMAWGYDESEKRARFWVKALDKLKFRSLSEIELHAVKAIKDVLGIRLSPNELYSQAIRMGWLAWPTPRNSVLIRKTKEVMGKCVISEYEVKVPLIIPDRIQVRGRLCIFPAKWNERAEISLNVYRAVKAMGIYEGGKCRGLMLEFPLELYLPPEDVDELLKRLEVLALKSIMP